MEAKPSFLKTVWTIRISSGKSTGAYVLRIKPMHLFLLLSLVSAAAFFLHGSYTAKTKAYETQLFALQDSYRKQELYVEKLQTEKKHIASLVDTQNKEMVEKLRDIESKNDEVRKIVGLKQKEEAVSAPISKRRTIKANRGLASDGALEAQMAKLHKEISVSGVEMTSIEKKARDYQEQLRQREYRRILDLLPSARPADGVISSPFGIRIHPVYGYARFHSGIDIAAPHGAPIYATASGKVSFSGYMSGYGNTVKIYHLDGLETLYGHCSSLYVRNGQYVRKGDLIASVGSTGVSTGPHVHYEVLVYGLQTDPEPYFHCSESRMALLRKKFGI